MVQPRKRKLAKDKGANPKTTVKTEKIENVLAATVELTIFCEVKSSVDYLSVGTNASIKTTVKKKDLSKTEDQLRQYMRDRVLDEHAKLDAARKAGRVV